MRAMRCRALLFFVLFLTPFSLFAQAPHAEWRTVETDRFRVHYPAPFEAWAREMASRLESTRDEVEKAVGWEIETRVDVLVMDPLAVANGSAWPLLGAPRIVLWTTPPPPESVIGHNRGWIEIVTVHEIAHLAHLTRPSRNLKQRLFARALPLGPLAFSPRWVSEGYATVIEGDLTTSGRPWGDFRAAVLRQWGRLGRLPSYDRLDLDRKAWMGMSMAYLAGSAYLEWLREGEGEEALSDLWRRMTAKEDRTFEEAFLGVFGESPQYLYGRFVAELTAKAMAVEDELKSSIREGELWQDLAWTTERPDISPDGSNLVTVVRERGKPSRMVVIETAPDTEAEEKYQERIDEMLDEDPEDVAPVRRRPLKREPEETLVTRFGAEPFTPRWMPDGESILFTRFEPDADGFFHPDLFLWNPEEESVRRVTRFADVREADPHPDGGSAVAVRNRHGYSQLVSVDLQSGAVDPLGEATLGPAHHAPRWGPDGSTIAFLRHERGRWRLFLRDRSGAEREISTPQDSVIAQPAWGADSSTLYAVVGTDGFIEIHRFDLDRGSAAQLTRSFGASLAPALLRDGSALFYLSVEPDGLDLRRLDSPATLAAVPRVTIDSSLAPAVRPAAASEPAPLFAAGEVSESRPYGFGRQETRFHSGFSWLPSTHSLELGLRAGDVVGRLSTLLTGAIGEDGSEKGASLASTWRGWPIHLRAHLFTAEHALSEQPDCESALPVCGNPFVDHDRSGGELALVWDRLWRTGRLEIESGLVAQNIGLADGDTLDQRILFAQLRQSARRSWGDITAQGDGSLRVERGETDGESWRRSLIHLRASAGSDGNELMLEWVRGGSDSISHRFDQWTLGGAVLSIVPAAAVSGRIDSPALPIGTAFGDEHETQKASLGVAGPLRAFYQRHRLWDDAMPHEDWIELAGGELTVTTAPFPLLKLPTLELRLGAARGLSDPIHDKTTWWISTSWRP